MKQKRKAKGASKGKGSGRSRNDGAGSALRDRRRWEALVRNLQVAPGERLSLERDRDPDATADFVEEASASDVLARGIELLSEEQEKLYAQDTYSLLIVLQAMDAAGKDGVIKHVMSGVNPQGCQVASFKAPSVEELDHDYLWRSYKALPERGRIGIFNRSYYEEVLVARVHPEILARQRLPPASRGTDLWKRRFEEINNFERHLVDNGTIVLKFFLHLGKDEQKRRFLARIDTPGKNWKFSDADVRERGFWDDYMHAYEEAFRHTSTPWAPWHVVPANHKWFTRIAVCAAIVLQLERLDLHFPRLTSERLKRLRKAGRLLRAER